MPEAPGRARLQLQLLGEVQRQHCCLLGSAGRRALRSGPTPSSWQPTPYTELMAACSLHPPCLASQVADRIRKHMSERVPRILPPEVEQVGTLGLYWRSKLYCVVGAAAN